MIKIFLPEIDCSQHRVRYIGSRSRYATATAAAFIETNLILAASLLGRKIYLISFNESSYEILDSVSTTSLPDLIDYKNNIIVTANNSPTISLYHFSDNKISFAENIILDPIINPHGCRITDDGRILIASKSMKSPGVFEYDLKSRKCQKIISDTYCTKDISFYNDLCVTISTKFTALSNPSDPSKSIISLYDNKNNLLDSMPINGQGESIAIINDDIFITDQENDRLIHCKIHDKKIVFIKNTSSLSFPHGICSFNDNIAVSNYGNNSIYIYNVSELI